VLNALQDAANEFGRGVVSCVWRVCNYYVLHRPEIALLVHWRSSRSHRPL